MAIVPTVGTTLYPQAHGYDGYIENVLIRLAVTEETPMQEVTADAEAPRVDTADAAEDIRDEVGQRYSRSNLSGGAGLDFLHAPNRPQDAAIRYWDSEGVDVFGAEKGETYSAKLMHSIVQVDSAAGITKAVQIDGDVYYLAGSSIYSVGSVLKDGLSATGIDMAAVGNTIFTLDGTDGVQKYSLPSWTPTNESATVFDRIWAVKARCLGVIDNLLYEVAPVIADVNEVQHIEHDATAGDFYLTLAGGRTPSLAYNVSTGDLDTAIQGLPGVTAVTVTGSTGAWFVTFTDPGAENITPMGWNDDGLVAGSMTVHTETQGVTGSPSTLLLTLPTADTVTDVVDTGTAILVFTTAQSVYSLAVDDALALSIAGESTWIDEVPIMAAESFGVIGIVTAEPTPAGGVISRFYTAGLSDTYAITNLQLIYQVGDRTTTQDLTAHSIESTRDSIYVVAPDEGETSSTAWRYYLPTGGYARSYQFDTNPARTITSLVWAKGIMWAAVASEGLWKESNDYVMSGYVTGPLADFFSSESKQWVSGEVTGNAPTGTSLELYDTNQESLLENPSSNEWRLVAVLRNPEQTESIVDMVGRRGRYHGAKVTLASDSSRTLTPELLSYSFRALSSPNRDTLIRMPINISDQIESPGKRAIRIKGRGQAIEDALRAYEGESVLVELYRPKLKIQGLIEKFGDMMLMAINLSIFDIIGN